MNYIKPAYPSSEFYPEKYINTDHWGSVPDKGTLPLQIKVVPINGVPFSKYHGMKLCDLQRLSREGCNLFFQPNHLVTKLVDGERVLSKPSSPAVLHAAYVDIGHSDDLEATLKIAPIKPQVAISSGRGLHLYFGIKPVHLAAMTGHLEGERIYHLKLFRRIQMRLCEIFNGDKAIPRNPSQAMRIPETLNYKIIQGELVRRECKTVFGQILDIYKSPQYEIFDLAKKLEIKTAETSKAEKILAVKNNIPLNPERRPKPLSDGWEEAYRKIVRACSISPKTAGNKSHWKFFKFIYGYRKLDYYLECPDDFGRYLSGLYHESHSRWRSAFTELGLIKKISDGNIILRKSSKYILTKKFYDIIEESPPIQKPNQGIFAKSKRNLPSLMEEIRPDRYPPHQLRNSIMPDYRRLRNAGMSEQEAESFFMNKLSTRDSFDERDNLNLIRHIAKGFRPLSVVVD